MESVFLTSIFPVNKVGETLFQKRIFKMHLDELFILGLHIKIIVATDWILLQNTTFWRVFENIPDNIGKYSNIWHKYLLSVKHVFEYGIGTISITSYDWSRTTSDGSRNLVV